MALLLIGKRTFRRGKGDIPNFKLARHAARVAGASVAGNRNNRRIAKGKANRKGKRAKGIEGKLLLSPGETNTSEVVPVIVPAPERAAGAPRIGAPGAPPNAAMRLR